MSLLAVATILIFDAYFLAHPLRTPTLPLLVEVALRMRNFVGWPMREPVAVILLAVLAVCWVALDALAGVPILRVLSLCPRFAPTFLAQFLVPPWRW